MAPKLCLREASNSGASRGVTARGRRGRNRGNRGSRGHGGCGGSTVTPLSAVVDEGVFGHDFILNIRGPVRRRIALPLSFVVVLYELNPFGLWLRAQGYPY